MAQSFEIEGRVKVLLDLQTFESGFTKREFVVETGDDKYPQMIKFECIKDKVQLLDSLKIDDPVRVSFDIRGNEYKGRYYVNLNAWKITPAGAAGGEGGAEAGASTSDSYFDNEPDPSDAEDDIPF